MRRDTELQITISEQGTKQTIQKADNNDLTEL